jgi:hypothetical protein
MVTRAAWATYDAAALSILCKTWRRSILPRADTRGPLPQLKVQQPWETRSMLLTLAVSRYRSTRDLVFAA